MAMQHKRSKAILELKEEGEHVSRFYVIEDGKRKQKVVFPKRESDLVVACLNRNVTGMS